MTEEVQHCGVVVLAAGQSSRLGSPKQLLPFAGVTLLQHTIDVALRAKCGPVLVVTGARHSEIESSIAGMGIETVYNAGWEEGMASSIRAGMKAMTERYPETDGIIFMVCDQPFVAESVLLCLIEAQRKSGKGITASVYEDKVGTPALFHRSFFDRLMELKGDKGARMLIAGHPDQVERVPFETGAIDIDTKEDYQRLLN